MFHQIKNVEPLPGFRLSVQFCEGVTKVYDLTPLFGKLPASKRFLRAIPSSLFVLVWTRAGMVLCGTTIWICPARNSGQTALRWKPVSTGGRGWGLRKRQGGDARG